MPTLLQTVTALIFDRYAGGDMDSPSEPAVSEDTTGSGGRNNWGIRV